MGIIPFWVAPVVGAILLGLVVWKSYDVGHNYGVALGDLKITQIKLNLEQKYSDQIKGLIAANQAAEGQQQNLVNQLDAVEAALAEQVAKNEELANKDPNANGCGIGSDSTDRLNNLK